MDSSCGRLLRVFAALGLACLIWGGVAPAAANKLELGADAPLWAQLGAAALLYLHIGGGAVGLASGTAAILSRKGGRVHRTAGTIFFVAMCVSYAVGAGVAPFLDEGQRPNFVAGVMALYLLITAWLAARRPDPDVRWTEYVGLAIALAIVAVGLLFMVQGANHPSGTVDGSPPQAFVLFAVVGTFAALGELHVIIRRRITGVSRVARHLWRMCMSLFIASGSFFLGQQQVLPEFMLGTLWQFGPVLFPLIAMAIWLVWVRLPAKTKPA